MPFYLHSSADLHLADCQSKNLSRIDWVHAVLDPLNRYTLAILDIPQVSGALNPDAGEGTKAFQECVLARHPRHGEYGIAFITGRTVLQVNWLHEEACCGIAASSRTAVSVSS